MICPRVPAARSALAASLVVLGVTVLAGCGTQAEDATARVESPALTRTGERTSDALEPGDKVPPPSGKVVLVVRGGTTTNVGDELRLDLDQLDALTSVEYAVDDRLATGRRVTFSGPLVRTLLDLAGAEDATTMHTVALNDYAVDIPVSDAEDLPLMLATRMDGRRMSVARYGPTRFVYPTDGYGLDPVVYEPRWIWQLRSIEVE
jgi:hypothetical protein